MIEKGPMAASEQQAKVAKAALKAVDDSLAKLLCSIETVVNSAKESDIHNVIQALKDLLDSSQTCRQVSAANLGVVEQTINMLLKQLEEVHRDNRALQGRVKTLETELDTVKRELQSVKQELQSQRHKILLGQLAYVVDNGVSQYVYGAGYDLYSSLADTRTDVTTSMVEAEQTRWAEVCNYLGRNGYKVRDSIGLTGLVRSLRFEVAHGTQEEIAAVTLEDLKRWGKEELVSVREENLDKLLQLAQLFSTSENPLVCAPPQQVAARITAQRM